MRLYKWDNSTLVIDEDSGSLTIDVLEGELKT